MKKNNNKVAKIVKNNEQELERWTKEKKALVSGSERRTTNTQKEIIIKGIKNK